MVNDVRRVVHDLGALRSHDFGISGGSALHVGLALPSVSELGDTEETSLYPWISRLRTIGRLIGRVDCPSFVPESTSSSVQS